jgi:three-Cys-motif partner protein
MAKEQKYHWHIGDPLPPLDRHSEVKHRIVGDYVRLYILRLMSQATIPALHLSLIDGFCGGGVYAHENGGLADGSPVLMMRAVQEARTYLNPPGRRVPREVNVDYHFIDILPDTTQYLRFWLDAKRQEGAVAEADFRQTKIVTNSFLAELPSLVQQIKAKRMGEHAIFVLDQYDYDDLPLPDIAGVLRSLKGAEVILTFNVGSLLTYLSDRLENRKPLMRIGLDKYVPWAELKTIKATEGRRWRQVLQRYIAHGIKKVTGAAYMTLFFVRPWGSTPWDYWLIHLSNRYRAHDVMKSLHWQHGTQFGHELEPGVFMLGYDPNEDQSYTGQTSFDFSESSRLACIDGVREHFAQLIYASGQPVRVKDIFEHVVTNSTAAETHLMAATSQLHGSKDLIITSKDGTVRRVSKTYHPDDVIEPSRQIILSLK